MAGTATNVTAGKPNNAGAVYYAPIGTPVPADNEATLDAAFKDLGFVSQEGVTRSISKSTTTIKEWGNGTVLITEDEKTVTYKFKLIEYLNPEVQKFVHGSANVTGTIAAGLHIGINDAEAEEHIIVIDQVMRGKKDRMVINRGVITEIGDTTYVGNNAVAYDLTITAMTPTAAADKVNEHIGGQSA